MAKSTKTSLKRRADQLVSQIVRLKGKCERCGKTEGLQCAHVISRSNHTLRFDLMNVLCLCSGCHINFAHQDPLGFSKWFQENYPARYEYLMHNKNFLTKRTLQDYKELVEALNKILNRLEKERIQGVIDPDIEKENEKLKN